MGPIRMRSFEEWLRHVGLDDEFEKIQNEKCMSCGSIPGDSIRCMECEDTKRQAEIRKEYESIGEREKKLIQKMREDERSKYELIERTENRLERPAGPLGRDPVSGRGLVSDRMRCEGRVRADRGVS